MSRYDHETEFAKLPPHVRALGTVLEATGRAHMRQFDENRVLVTPLMAKVRGDRGLSRELDSAIANGDELGAVAHAARPVDGCACLTCERHRGDAREALARRAFRVPFEPACFPAYPHFYPDP